MMYLLLECNRAPNFREVQFLAPISYLRHAELPRGRSHPQARRTPFRNTADPLFRPSARVARCFEEIGFTRED
jgi:hypothetical protein